MATYVETANGGTLDATNGRVVFGPYAADRVILRASTYITTSGITAPSFLVMVQTSPNDAGSIGLYNPPGIVGAVTPIQVFESPTFSLAGVIEPIRPVLVPRGYYVQLFSRNGATSGFWNVRLETADALDASSMAGSNYGR